jgi:hypothetical protein
MEAFILRAKMDIRAPRANRGAGLRGQGCYRPDAVSARTDGPSVASLAQHLLKEVIGDSFAQAVAWRPVRAIRHAAS